MMTNSKARSPAALKTYHDREFSAVRENYYTAGDHIVSAWHGRGASAFGLAGSVGKHHFDRLADGQHPQTGAQLVQHQTPRLLPNGKMSMGHRAGWDLTFNCTKDGSLTALVGGDDTVRQAHVESVSVALDVVERYTQVRLGGNLWPETTGAWVAARFEHDCARPVKGYPAPHLHTHVVVMNMTQRADGTVGPVQPKAWFKHTQRYATRIYRAEFARRLQDRGYAVSIDKRGVVVIDGYTQEYLDAASPRRQQILDELARQQRSGAKAAQQAAHDTRDKKIHLSPEIVHRMHQDMAATFGHQPQHVVDEARQRRESGLIHEHQPAHYAVTYARAVNSERHARFDERQLLGDALVRGARYNTFAEIHRAFEMQTGEGKFLEVPQTPGAPGRAFTTPEMLALERENITTMRIGQHTHPPLVQAAVRRDVGDFYPQLNDGQRGAIEQILGNRDTVQALEGLAGTGKTRTLGVLYDAAARDGYTVQGLAPTSGAVRELNVAGIPSITLQQHNAFLERGTDTPAGRALYVLDESSLASTAQVHRFFAGLQHQDRVLLVGDTKQHEAVDAGRPFAQLQEAGVSIARLEIIVRQTEPGLLAAVEHLAAGRVQKAVALFDGQGRIHEVVDKDDRYGQIAAEFVKAPTTTLVISPDNESRAELNTVIHQAMQTQGLVSGAEYSRQVLVARSDLTGADREWAARYQPDDVIRYTQGSESVGLTRGSYATVVGTEATDAANRLTVRTDAGRTLTYDPARLSGVTVYRQEARQFAAGDRVQFTTPDRPRGLANRQLGTIDTINRDAVTIRLDAGGQAIIPAHERQHFDYGYTLTSYSSQAQTVDFVLLNIDVDQPDTLVNDRLAYVGPSRARLGLQIFTNAKSDLARVLSRDLERPSALDLDDTREHARNVAPAHQQLQPMHGEL